MPIPSWIPTWVVAVSRYVWLRRGLTPAGLTPPGYLQARQQVPLLSAAHTQIGVDNPLFSGTSVGMRRGASHSQRGGGGDLSADQAIQDSLI